MSANPTQSAPLVCLVDDDPSIRRSVTRMLEFDGISVRAFKEVEPFLVYISDHVVPVAIIDLGMQKLSALELMTTIWERSPEIHIIFISGDEDQGAQLPPGRTDACGFFVKPFDDSKFLRSLHQILSHPHPATTSEDGHGPT